MYTTLFLSCSKTGATERGRAGAADFSGGCGRSFCPSQGLRHDDSNSPTAHSDTAVAH